MQFELPAGEFADAVGKVRGCVPTRSTMPILTNILVTAENDSVSVRATTLEVEATARIPAAVQLPGALAVSGDVLAGLTKRQPKTEGLRFGVTNSGVEVAVGRSRYQLRSLSADEFPERRFVKDGVSFVVTAKAFAALLAEVRYAVSLIETQVAMQGVHLHIVGDNLVAVASDGHRLARASMPTPAGAEGMPGVVLSARFAGEIVSALESHAGEATVSVSEARVGVDLPGLSITAPLIDATFPDYQRLLPEVGPPTFAFKAKDLAGALDRAHAVISSMDTKAPRATLRADGADALRCEVGTMATDRAREVIDAKCAEVTPEAAPGEIDLGVVGVNAKYLAEAVKMFGEAAIDAWLAPNKDKVIFTSAERPEALHLIMAMRGES